MKENNISRQLNPFEGPFSRFKRHCLVFSLNAFVCILLFSCNAPQKENSSPKQSNSIIEKLELKAIGNTMAEMAFDQKELKVRKNSKVILTLVNESSDATMKHNVLIVKKGSSNKVGMAAIALKDKNYVPDMPEVIAASDLAQPGETVLMEFNSPDPGEYEFICTFPGHHTKMKGIFVVY